MTPSNSSPDTGAGTSLFQPDYDWTSTCPHDETISECPDGDDGCRCECHAVRLPEETPR